MSGHLMDLLHFFESIDSFLLVLLLINDLISDLLRQLVHPLRQLRVLLLNHLQVLID